jgi:shikimate dehydrogenase
MTIPFRKACIMGHPVAQSRSPMIHNHWLNALTLPGHYDRRDLTPEDFAAFVADLSRHGYVGGNVTVPHKEAAYLACSRLDDAALAIGAVNTLWLEDGVLCGGNSDCQGFIDHLDASVPDWQVADCRALVLGAGGAARAAVFALAARGVKVAIVNRHADRALSLARHFSPGASGQVSGHAMDELALLLPAIDLLVNCTSMGMAGKPALDLDFSPLRTRAVVYDIVYVPLETALLRWARDRGNPCVDGLGMLLQQAGYGFSKWFGVRPEPSAALRELIAADIRAKT